MELLNWLPRICGLILLLFFAWQMLDWALSWLKERHQKQDAPTETDVPQISYAQPGDGGTDIPVNHAE